jgi:hypothetical protein
MRADEGNRRRGSRLVRNGATSLRAGCGKQHPQHRPNQESGAKSTAQKRWEYFVYSPIHGVSLRFLRLKEHAEKGDFRLPFLSRRTVRRIPKESNAPAGDFFIPY